MLYGCEVFENRILRRIFRPKRDANGERRRLHNEELHSLYRSPNTVRMIKSKRLRWVGRITRMEEDSVIKIVTGTRTENTPLGRSRRRWEDKVRIDLKEICINTSNWVDSAQDNNWRTLVNAALNLRVS